MKRLCFAEQHIYELHCRGSITL